MLAIGRSYRSLWSGPDVVLAHLPGRFIIADWIRGVNPYPLLCLLPLPSHLRGMGAHCDGDGDVTLNYHQGCIGIIAACHRRLYLANHHVSIWHSERYSGRAGQLPGRLCLARHAASLMLGFPASPWGSGLVFGPSASFAHGVNVDAEMVSAVGDPTASGGALLRWSASLRFHSALRG